MILRYLQVSTPFFFSLILLKPLLNTCGLSQKNVQRVRYSPSREPGTCMLCHSIYFQVVKVHLFNYSISWVSYVHSSRTTDESLHYFVLPSENQNAFARSADFEFHLILHSRIETARHLVRSDFFAKVYTKL